MTKKQKIWLTIFGAIFLVPEVLWGGVRLLILTLFLQSKYLTNLGISIFPEITNNLSASLISITQFIGLLCFTAILLKLKINLFIKFIIILTLSLLLFFSFIFAWMGFYYLGHNPNF